MDVREKLVELCEDLETLPCCDTYEGQADCLIAHGVTVQEWISVKDRLPPAGHRPYLTCRKTMSGRKIIETRYLQTSYFTPHVAYWEGKKNGEVTHWMPLPQPPKGE